MEPANGVGIKRFQIRIYTHDEWAGWAHQIYTLRPNASFNKISILLHFCWSLIWIMLRRRSSEVIDTYSLYTRTYLVYDARL